MKYTVLLSVARQNLYNATNRLLEFLRNNMTRVRIKINIFSISLNEIFTKERKLCFPNIFNIIKICYGNIICTGEKNAVYYFTKYFMCKI